MIQYVSGGIPVGTESKVLFTSKGSGGSIAPVGQRSPAGYENPLPSPLNNMGPVAMWGKNNLLPAEMATDIERTGVLSATIDAKTRIAIGKGPTLAKKVGIDENGMEQLEFVTDAEVEDFLEANNAFQYSYATGRDLYAMGNAFSQLLISKDRKQITGFKRNDPAECRFSIRDPKTLKSSSVYLSSDWSMYAVPADNKNKWVDKHTACLPLLDMDFPLMDLQGRDDAFCYMLATQYPLWNRHYYAPSPWYCAKDWVDISQAIPQMKDAMFRNQMSIKYIVEIHPQFWELFDPTYKAADDAGKKDIQDKWYKAVDKYLVGGDNSYKSLFSAKVVDNQTQEVVSAITVTAVDDKIQDGKLIPDGAAADSQILFALSMNPALIGLSIPGANTAVTAGSGSNIREAFLVQLLMQTTEQYMISRIFNLIKNYNGWDKQYVLRYPNQILTTLNTGANTQSLS